MRKQDKILFGIIISVWLIVCVNSSVTYRVLKTDPNSTKAMIDIREQALYWSLVLRFNNKVKLRVNSGGTIISSSPEGNIYIIAGSPIERGQNQTVTFESKYDKKSAAKLISATYNGKPVKIN